MIYESIAGEPEIHATELIGMAVGWGCRFNLAMLYPASLFG
ncbi:hypothetical protein [Dysgonomonas capnocytophagoides]|nr:hypothetical protein [Dysgonomonas capnocytophagoides]